MWHTELIDRKFNKREFNLNIVGRSCGENGHFTLFAFIAQEAIALSRPIYDYDNKRPRRTTRDETKETQLHK